VNNITRLRESTGCDRLLTSLEKDLREVGRSFVDRGKLLLLLFYPAVNGPVTLRVNEARGRHRRGDE
jgi:hypothetical protein